MESTPGSTIAALCYARDTKIDFATVLAALPPYAWQTGGGAALDMPTQDYVLCDTDGQRVGLALVALDRTFPGAPTGRHFPSCLLVSVGSDGTAPMPATQPRFDRVLADLLLRIQEIAPADRVLMYERAGVFDSALHDAVVDELRSHLDRILAPAVTTAIAPEPAAGAQAPGGPWPDKCLGMGMGDDDRATAPLRVARSQAGMADRMAGGMAGGILPPNPSLVPPLAPPHATSLTPSPAPSPAPSAASTVAPSVAPTLAGRTDAPDDIVQLAARLETELERLTDTRRAQAGGDAVSEYAAPRPRGLRRGLPQGFPRLAPASIPRFLPRRSPARDSRPETAYPDYADMPANINERPLLHRAAVNALNVSVMTIALPVGAALLTMSALGREDMLTSSRVTAITGVMVGLHNTGVTDWVQALFL